jgi:hypothetical protein
VTVTELIAALRELEPEHGGKEVKLDADDWLYDCGEAYVGDNTSSHDPDRGRRMVVILGR